MQYYYFFGINIMSSQLSINSSNNALSYKTLLRQNYNRAYGLDKSAKVFDKEKEQAFTSALEKLRVDLVNAYHNVHYSKMEQETPQTLTQIKILLIEERRNRNQRINYLNKKLENLTSRYNTFIKNEAAANQLANTIQPKTKQRLKVANDTLRNMNKAKENNSADKTLRSINTTIDELVKAQVECVEFAGKSEVFSDLRLIGKIDDDLSSSESDSIK